MSCSERTMLIYHIIVSLRFTMSVNIFIPMRRSRLAQTDSLSSFLYSWVFSKLVPKTSRTHETLKFLLDHPRRRACFRPRAKVGLLTFFCGYRCFVYLFPSTQTWFLFLVMVTLTYVFDLPWDTGPCHTHVYYPPSAARPISYPSWFWISEPRKHGKTACSLIALT